MSRTPTKETGTFDPDTIEAIREGIADGEAGREQPLEEYLTEMRDRHTDAGFQPVSSTHVKNHGENHGAKEQAKMMNHKTHLSDLTARKEKQEHSEDAARPEAIVEERFSPVLRNILDIYRGDKRIPIPRGQRKR